MIPWDVTNVQSSIWRSGNTCHVNLRRRARIRPMECGPVSQMIIRIGEQQRSMLRPKRRSAMALLSLNVESAKGDADSYHFLAWSVFNLRRRGDNALQVYRASWVDTVATNCDIVDLKVQVIQQILVRKLAYLHGRLNTCEALWFRRLGIGQCRMLAPNTPSRGTTVSSPPSLHTVIIPQDNKETIQIGVRIRIARTNIRLRNQARGRCSHGHMYAYSLFDFTPFACMAQTFRGAVVHLVWSTGWRSKLSYDPAIIHLRFFLALCWPFSSMNCTLLSLMNVQPSTAWSDGCTYVVFASPLVL
jgi:hypothetical protein